MQFYFALMGTVLLCTGFLMAYRRVRIALHGIDAEAWVLAPLVNEIDGFKYTATRVGYRDLSGNELQFTHYPGTPGSLPPGSSVTVRYLPGLQGQQLVPSLTGYFLAPTVLMALAAVCLWVAVR